MRRCCGLTLWSMDGVARRQRRCCPTWPPGPPPLPAALLLRCRFWRTAVVRQEDERHERRKHTFLVRKQTCHHLSGSLVTWSSPVPRVAKFRWLKLSCQKWNRAARRCAGPSRAKPRYLVLRLVLLLVGAVEIGRNLDELDKANKIVDVDIAMCSGRNQAGAGRSSGHPFSA